MYIGIIDQDLLQQKVFNPNLETMQLSTYHKQKKDIVELVITSKNIEKYDKLYLIKNINDHNFLPKVIADPRTECIGLGFTNGKYIPNSTIDSLIADTSIYDKYIKANYDKMSAKNQQRVRNLKNTQHIRINLGDKLNWVPPREKRAQIYDLDPTNIPGMLEYCNNYNKVKFNHKCYVNTFTDIIKWLNQKWFLEENQLYFTGTFNDKDFKHFVNLYKNHNKAPYFIINLKNTEKQMQEELALWLNRSLYALTRESNIKIYIPFKSNYSFYNTMFTKIQKWNNKRYRGKSFAEIARTKTTEKEFDKLCERDYNINRMVHIVPNQYKKERNWDYVN